MSKSRDHRHTRTTRPNDPPIIAAQGHKPEPNEIPIDPYSPWAHIAENLAASASHYSELSNASGTVFSAAQHEACESYEQQEATKRGAPSGRNGR